MESLGYNLEEQGKRFKFYLTNTLEREEPKMPELPHLVKFLTEESKAAGKVKKETPILVVFGNPPYSGHSANASWKIIEKKEKGKIKKNRVLNFIGELLQDYYKVDGKPLGEKNPKWLQDDYVKFIRFAQWKIEQLGEGVLGFITNHSYLDNPTFRGMRQSLMNSFNEFYILDLHGNSLKKEKCPDGSKDENVFDIRQGVAIALFIKRKNNKLPATVYHADLWGLRENKYSSLFENDIKTIKWQKLEPKSEFYLFVPRDEKLLEIYKKYPKITEIFATNSVGVVTARDNLTIQWTPEKVWSTVLSFSKMSPEMAREAYNLGKDARDWKVELAQKDLIESRLDKKRIVPILYRPFDVRFTYYTGKSRGFHCRPRPKVMRHMQAGENLGLLTCRQQNRLGFYHASVCNTIIESCAVSNQTREITYLFPLYLYPDETSDALHKGERVPNINRELLKDLPYKSTPEQLFYYIYAVLYSNVYRKKYAEFLKIAFPRIPFTKDYETFSKLAIFGEKLVNLHLLKSNELDKPLAKFQGEGDFSVEKVAYKDKKVYINKTQYFENVPQDVWQYQIGGYQVLDKWLKSRKDRNLSLDEIKLFCQVITALAKTIELQAEIDKIYPSAEQTSL